MTYASLEDADRYFATRLLVKDWEYATDADRLAALTEATQLIDQLAFRDDFDPTDPITASDLTVATCEVAIKLVGGTDVDMEVENLFVDTHSYAAIKTGYDRTRVPEHLRAGIPSVLAWNILRPYLRNPRKVRLRRVN